MGGESFPKSRLEKYRVRGERRTSRYSLGVRLGLRTLNLARVAGVVAPRSGESRHHHGPQRVTFSNCPLQAIFAALELAKQASNSQSALLFKEPAVFEAKRARWLAGWLFFPSKI